MRHGVIIVVILLTLISSGCGSATARDQEPRPLTMAEAERLAVARFNNHERGTLAVDGYVLGGPERVQLTGWIDYSQSTGYAALYALGSAGTKEPLGLVRWAHGLTAFRPVPAAEPALPIPQDQWQTKAADPSGSALESMLAIVLHLGRDRPDNPLLIIQSDARWLRQDQIAGVPVDVMTGQTAPASDRVARTRYWIDAAGVTHRFETLLGSATQWSTIDLRPADHVTLPPFAWPS